VKKHIWGQSSELRLDLWVCGVVLVEGQISLGQGRIVDKLELWWGGGGVTTPHKAKENWVTLLSRSQGWLTCRTMWPKK
jgi:hypothetical protein